jgi:DNA-binding MarR family transcriptional regulator
MWDNMLSKNQLQLLSYLGEKGEQEMSIGDLADGLDWSIGHTSRVVSELETNGYVLTRKMGRYKLVTLTDIEPIEQLEGLFSEYSHVNFPALLSGAALRLLYHLDRSRTVTELAEVSDIGRSTAYRQLDELQRVGIVGKSKSHYQLNEPFTTLSEIARGLAHHRHRREAEQYAESINIFWETHNEYLFACDGEINADRFHRTGPAQFAEFNIPLLTRKREHYFRSDRIQSISPAELVCHTLLIDDGSRYRTYSLLLIKKHGIEPTAFQECTAYYAPEADIDLQTIGDELITYLETEGETTTKQLPTWEDFKSTAADYEITV